MNTHDFDAQLEEQRRKLEAFAREAEAIIDRLNDRLHRRVTGTFTQLFHSEAKHFSGLVESLVRESVERVLEGAFPSSGGRKGSLSASRLQQAADFLGELERARRNV